ncbi:GLPGLI family protein [Paenimyroides tangerinum]|uniref:GLPGLI family protein n=1 Tax=Paenimyroides tangerinum TaxID=2488728 RepID=A0A3P3W5Z4_9FLAO|nr:GLPGLI family protein [Paenimyroides tangerinum]RRJ90561.1 GLPGLI family protein [Paenimyroides tangerinum]
MKNKIILMLFFLITIKNFAQIISGKITYKVTKEYNTESESYKFFKSQNPDCFYDELADEISYEMQFSNKQYLFYAVIDNLSNIRCADKILTVLGTMNPDDFNLFNEDTFYRYMHHLGSHLIISKKPYEWIITEETKTIQNFTCYKAYFIETIDLGDEVKTNTHIVWFTPDLPFSYGPGNYYGLPGVILEANNMGGKYTYGASKIELNIENPKLENNIKKLKEISKEITLEEYMKM